MTIGKRLLILSALGALFVPAAIFAQQAPAAASSDTGWTAEQDHQNMMDQLGIKTLRPGPNANQDAPNAANYDEAKANPYPDLPEVLRLNNGKWVTSAEMWWNQRRPEIVEEFEREVLGRVPENVPDVTWEVTETVETDGRFASGDRQAACRPRRQLRCIRRSKSISACRSCSRPTRPARCR